MLVGGDWVAARSGETFETVDPFTARPWATLPRAGPEDVDAAVGAARRAFDDGPWRRAPASERARLLRRLAELVEERALEIATIEVTDNGKLLREMEQQLRGLPDYLHYWAGAADKIGGETIPGPSEDWLIYTRREPVGVVAAITPWNSPVLLLTWKLAPALAAGCTVVVKPAEQAPASTLELARLVEEAGFPPGVVNVLTGFGPDAGAPLAAHPGVDKVAFTGSTATGSAVMRGAAEHLARVSLELGGKSPQVVFADADLEAAANGVVAGVFAATGQTCMAGSRLLVEREVHDELLARVAARAREVRLGDPLEAETEMGPVAFEGHLENVQRRIAAAEAEGARLVAGGRRPDRAGLLHRADRVRRRARATWRSRARRCSARCSPCMPFSGEEEAVRMANDTASGSPPACGRATCGARTGSRTRSAPGPCGSTPTAPSGRWRPSAASRPAGWGARTGSRRSTSTPSTRPCGWSSAAPRATRSSSADPNRRLRAVGCAACPRRTT